jgi:hypothetical protein
MKPMKMEIKREGANPHEEAVELNVFVVHEDLESALRAKQDLDRIAGQLGFCARFQLNLWNLCLLSDPDRQKDAAEEARRSDIVLLSAQDGRGLPLRIYAWLEDCLRVRARNPRALAVSLNTSARNFVKENPVVKRIRAIARKSGADFFAHFGAAPTEAGNGPDETEPGEFRVPWIEDGTAAQW